MTQSSTASKTPTHYADDSPVMLLNQALADTVDLRMQARQAALNVKGAYVVELNSLFNGLARDLRESTDIIARRIVALGGRPIATVRSVARHSHLREYPMDALDANEHLQALLSSYSRYELSIRNTRKTISETNDAETARLLDSIADSIERNLWLLEAHLEGIAVGLHGGKLPKWTPAFPSRQRRSDKGLDIIPSM
jgi:starvation-inducible DNA-binding protein